ncbi:UNVERIFIED_CONTAM: hypothetical protein GTU68_062759 [Idotea baltica]|nr:hypothetical protein [Idotea baltica]
MGGHLKQYEVAISPSFLKSLNIGITDVFDALQNSNENTGGAYIEKNPNTYYIRTNGIARSITDIENVVVTVRNHRPILIKDVATVQFGKAPRYGALVRDGAEAVGGRVMMIKGANSAAVTERIVERVEQIQKSLPEGVVIEPYLVRDKLVSTAIGTVKKNLIEGGLIVIFILVLLLGNWRAGLIVATVIPLAMLFAISMMNVLGISANLMSLGAIDFGLIVDGAVIIVEAVVHRLQVKFGGQKLTQVQINKEVELASHKIRSSAAFGEIIILMVYIPILALVGIEGKMFKPMAQTVMLAIAGALILSLTYVPMMCALFLNKNINNKTTLADRMIALFQKLYDPILAFAMRFKGLIVLGTLALFIYSIFVFSRMGGEFIPTLEEGDLAMQQILPPGTSLTQSIEMAALIQRKLLNDFPEIKDVVTNIGAAEIPTDPMPVEIGDYVLAMKPKSEWTSASNRKEMFEKIEKSLSSIPGVGYEFSQPIQLRFNELMTGSKADIAIKLYGEDLDLLYSNAKEAESYIAKLDGVGSVNVEQTIGMPQIVINFKYDKMAQYGLQVKNINQIVRTAFAGEQAGIIYEGEKRFDLVVRLDEKFRNDLKSVQDLFITLKNGIQVPLESVADVNLVDAPMQISRDNTNRRIVIGVNVGDTDIETLVAKIQKELDQKIKLPPGYYFTYGGQFENLKAANARLKIAVPLALALIFILLFFTFQSTSQAALIFTAIPLSAIGGIWALQLRGMPFSISAGIGFIALFGVAVLNGIVLIGYFNQLKDEGMMDITERIRTGTKVRLRPVLMTASVASLGFLPMAISHSGGAEVQRPLATVVIGGLISATFLTLVVLPILYDWLTRWKERKTSSLIKTGIFLFPFFFIPRSALAQKVPMSLQDVVNLAAKNNPMLWSAEGQVDASRALEDLRYHPGTTEIHYQGDGLFKANDQQLNQISIRQEIRNPAAINAQNSRQEQITMHRSLQMSLARNKLTYEVTRLYQRLQQRKEQQHNYQQLAELYRQYYEMAELRVNVGSTNNIERLTLQSALQEYQMLSRQNTIEISMLESELQTLANTGDSITSSDQFLLWQHVSKRETTSVREKMAMQKVNIEGTEVALLQAEMKPNFSIGYAAQKYFDGGWLTGLQAGISLPLFRKQTKQRISSQQIKTKVAASNYEAEMLRTKQDLQALEYSIEIYAQGATYYKDQIENINPEIARISQLNYQAGEISYLELVNTLNLLAKNKNNYWEQILAHNQAIALYQFLTNP